MLVTALATYGVGASSAFVYRQLDFDAGAAAQTTRDVVLQALGLDHASPHLFLLMSDTYQDRLLELPAVTGAEVTVSLPDTIRVRLAEREPLVVWSIAGRRFLVDRTGMLFATAISGGPGDGLPIVADRRIASVPLEVGGHVDPVDLDAATRLAGVEPGDLGTIASELRVSIEDGDGFVIRPVGVPWIALFGVYTPSIRAPAMIPGQVRLLRSLLEGREFDVKRVILADERSGTYVAR